MYRTTSKLVVAAGLLAIACGPALAKVDPGGNEVAQDLADHVFVAGFLEIGLDHCLGIGLGLDSRKAHLFSGPLAKQPVAAGVNPELHFLVMSELRFFGAFTIVEVGHFCS